MKGDPGRRCRGEDCSVPFIPDQLPLSPKKTSKGSFVPSFIINFPLIQEDQSRTRLDKKDNMNLIQLI